MCNMYPAEPKTETKGGAGGGHTLSSRADTTSWAAGAGVNEAKRNEGQVPTDEIGRRYETI